MRLIGLCLLCMCVWSAVKAETIRVAVASNFNLPAQDLAKAFEAESGHRVLLSSGSTGKLFAQIRYGAPFDVFLSADQDRAEKLEQAGYAVAGSRFTYAQGRLALYPASSIDMLKGDVSRIALANPKTAPYGRAAKEVLLGVGQLDRLSKRLVYGENIAQTYQFVATKNVDVAFVALSQVIDQPNKVIIDPVLYSPIAQDAVQVKDGQAAAEFLQFLKSDLAKKLMARYGY